jgi:hypothetical protein
MKGEARVVGTSNWQFLQVIIRIFQAAFVGIGVWLWGTGFAICPN